MHFWISVLVAFELGYLFPPLAVMSTARCIVAFGPLAVQDFPLLAFICRLFSPTLP